MEPTEGGTAAQKRLLELTRKRLERFVTLVPKFLVADDPDTIHDLRVWSRRLQQTIRALLPQTRTQGSRKAIKILRRVRQALGSLRNLDVNTELVQNRLEKAPSPLLRRLGSAQTALAKQSRSPARRRAQGSSQIRPGRIYRARTKIAVPRRHLV